MSNGFTKRLDDMDVGDVRIKIEYASMVKHPSGQWGLVEGWEATVTKAKANILDYKARHRRGSHHVGGGLMATMEPGSAGTEFKIVKRRVEDLIVSIEGSK